MLLVGSEVVGARARPALSAHVSARHVGRYSRYVGIISGFVGSVTDVNALRYRRPGVQPVTVASPDGTDSSSGGPHIGGQPTALLSRHSTLSSASNHVYDHGDPETSHNRLRHRPRRWLDDVQAAADGRLSEPGPESASSSLGLYALTDCYSDPASVIDFHAVHSATHAWAVYPKSDGGEIQTVTWRHLGIASHR